MGEPRKIVLDDGAVIYKCRECEEIVQEDGRCFEASERCFYCPPETCSGCGRGFCDQSC